MATVTICSDFGAQENKVCHYVPIYLPWSDRTSWRRKWQPTPVLLPGESHGGKSLVGYSSWGRKESDTTEWLHFTSLYFWVLFSVPLIYESGETMETMTDVIFLGSKITADGDCSHEIKRCLLLGRKATTNLDSILKSRDIILPTKVHLVKAMFFPVVMYGCESWTLKKAERWRIDAFEQWYWRRLLRVSWTARRSNQLILRKLVLTIHWRTDAEVEALIIWPPDGRNWLIGKDPDAEKDWRQEEKGTTEDEMVGWHYRLDGHELEQAPRVVMDRAA